MISIIVPMYNSECYLKECLSSVLKQTEHDFELLLVDDGSVDSTCAICKEFMRGDSRIHLYVQRHRGVSAARNAALDAARGEYIFFLDSDDAIAPDALEVLLEQILLQKADIAFGKYKTTDMCFTDGREKGKRDREWQRFDSGSLIDQFSQKNFIFGGIGGKLIKRKAIGALRFEEGLILGEDTLFFYELICKGLFAVYITDAVYYYRKNERGSWHLRFTLDGVLVAGSVFKRIEVSEQNCGRTENARFWEEAYFRILKRAMDCLPENELYQMREAVIQEMRDPYFRERSWVTKGSVFLAFFSYPFYCWAKRLKDSVKCLPGGEDDKII